MRPRAREVGVETGVLETGARNSIADVEGVRVGHVTLVRGQGKLVPGKGPVRTGVTAILPHRGNAFREKVPTAAFVLNGYGKSIGLVQIDEFGTLETPILLTNTLNVGLVADALVGHMLKQNDDIGVTTGSVNPVVMECNDSYLNDIRGRHVKAEHVSRALKEADVDVQQGAVGAGTGMSAFGFKGGIGTSSRLVEVEGEGYVVGCLVLSNFGRREDLTIKGVPVGRMLRACGKSDPQRYGSIIMVLATDAPVSPRQLHRLAKRATLGLARTGGSSYNSSGDIVLAFSTAYRIPHYPAGKIKLILLRDDRLNPLLKAAAEATEEAIVDSLFKADTTEGRDRHVREGIPVDDVLRTLQHTTH